MQQTLLFAIDPNTGETLVSASSKGSNRIQLLERIAREAHPVLNDAVLTLTGLARSPDLDPAIFRAMSKVCQMLYRQHSATTQPEPEGDPGVA